MISTLKELAALVAVAAFVAMVLLWSALAHADDNPFVECGHLLDTSRAAFKDCLKTYGVSDEESEIGADYLIRHHRDLNRVMDKIVCCRYLVYRPDGKLVTHVDQDALSADEEKCVDDDFSTADECLEHLGWRFVEKPLQGRP